MYVNSILIVSENSYLVIIPFKDSDCILLLLLSQVVSLFTELCNPHPVGVPQDVDVSQGAEGDEQEEEAQKEGEYSHGRLIPGFHASWKRFNEANCE